MAGSIRKRRNIKSMPSTNEGAAFGGADMNNPASEMEVFAKEVLTSLINDNLPPTPNNYSLYFDRLMEDKSENLRKQITGILELEDDNDAEKTIALEKSLKQGFSSIKNMLQVAANLYKNMALMAKILDKRKAELGNSPDDQMSMNIINELENDVHKLNGILKKQIDQLKGHYEQTATLVKNVEQDTIFDNQYGVYNKRYLLQKLEQEISLVQEFKHSSSLIMIELSKSLLKEIGNEKAAVLMIRTIARLLMKTSRRSDLVAHYGNGVFAMILKHTDLGSAEKASERLCDLVSSSNFFLAEREVQLKISIGIKSIMPEQGVEEQVIAAVDAMAAADRTPAGYQVHEEPAAPAEEDKES
jgi:diguanylate cyclase (GGDEF)-like protein